jgi:hypothetical protein
VLIKAGVGENDRGRAPSTAAARAAGGRRVPNGHGDCQASGCFTAGGVNGHEMLSLVKLLDGRDRHGVLFRRRITPYV